MKARLITEILYALVETDEGVKYSVYENGVVIRLNDDGSLTHHARSESNHKEIKEVGLEAFK